MIDPMVWYIIAGVVVIYILASLKAVQQTDRGLIERFGKYNRFAEPGLHLVLAGIDRLDRMNITEIMVNAEPQEIITKDNLNAMVDAQVYYKINEDEKSVKFSKYNVNDVEYQMTNLARTTLRNIIGNLTLVQANSERNKINSALMSTLEKETKNWGIRVVRTELKEIKPPEDVQETMNKVVKAENEKRAAVDYATARETQADGEKRAAVKQAEGAAQAVKIAATAKAEAIKLVNESANKYFTGNAQLLKRYEVTENTLRDNSKIVLTSEGIDPVIVFGDANVVPLRKKAPSAD